MYKVLIVDDDRATRYILRRFEKWEAYGFSIQDEARDGKEALEKINSHKFSLVITDIRMPGMDGIEFMYELRHKKLDICVIFLSTHSDFEYAKQGIRLGVFDYMTKPVDEEVLGEVLERTKKHLDEKQLQKIKSEEDKRIIEDSIDIYYTKNQEKKLVGFMMTGDATFLEEAKIVFNNIVEDYENDLFKCARLLEVMLTKLSAVIYDSYPWLLEIEKINFETIKDSLISKNDLEDCFMIHMESLLEVIKKYELHHNDSIIKKICEYVITHVEDDINLEVVAGEIHLRRDYIGKLFKNKTGLNFNDYVTKIKMEHAKYLIGTGKYKNYEISEMLCYSSSDYFCRLFKKYTGYTPIEYRKIGSPFTE